MSAGFVKNLYVSLHTDDPGDTFNHEVDYPGYKRQLGIFMKPSQPDSGESVIYWKNITLISFVSVKKNIKICYAGIEINNKCLSVPLSGPFMVAGLAPTFELDSIKIADIFCS